MAGLDVNVKYDLVKLRNAKTELEKVYSSQTSGYVANARTAYDDFLTVLSSKWICKLDSPNRIKANSWESQYGGVSIYNELQALQNQADGLIKTFYQVYNEIEKNDADDITDQSTGLMSGSITITMPDGYSAEEIESGGVLDALCAFLLKAAEVIARAVVAVVDMCISLILGLGVLVEGIIDAAAMLIGDGYRLAGNVEMANKIRSFIEIDHVNDLADKYVYGLLDVPFNFFTGKSFKEFSLLGDGAIGDGVRGIFQETGRWVGICALSCILPGSGAVIGGVLGGVSGFGIGAEDAFQAGLGWGGANLWAAGRAITDAFIGKNLGAQFSGGMSWNQYTSSIKKPSDFFKVTGQALKQGGHDFVSLITYTGRHVAAGSGNAVLNAIGSKTIGRVALSLGVPALVGGIGDSIFDGIVGKVADKVIQDGTNNPGPPDRVPDPTPEVPKPEPEPELPTPREDETTDNLGGGGGGGYQGSDNSTPDTDGTAEIPDTGTPDNTPTDPEYQGGEGDTPNSETPGSETPSDGDASGDGDTPSSDTPNGDDDYQGGDETPGDDEPSGDGDSSTEPGGDDGYQGGDEPGADTPGTEPGDDSGQGDTDPSSGSGDETPGDGDQSGGDASNDPSHPKVTIDNIGDSSVTLKDAGAATLGAGALGAAGQYIYGGEGGYGGYGGVGTIDSTPQYSATPTDKDKDEDDDKKEKYTFESMTPTVENPALDAGLLDAVPPANVTVEGPEPTVQPEGTVEILDTPTPEQTSTQSEESSQMNADKTNLNTVLGLGGISAGLGVGGVYVAHAKKDAEKEERTQNAAKGLGVAGGMMAGALADDDDDEDERNKNRNGFNQF